MINSFVAGLSISGAAYCFKDGNATFATVNLIIFGVNVICMIATRPPTGDIK